MPSNGNSDSDSERWIDSTVERPSMIPDFERRDFMKTTGVAAALGLTGTSSVSAESDDQYYRKTRPTVFTEQERQNAFENIEQYDWAAETRDRSVENAERILELWDFEDMWRLVGSQNIPRARTLTPWVTYASTTDWHWKQPEEDHWGFYTASPDWNWEISKTMEIDGEEHEIHLPTNDFAAYRESGRDETGQFDPELADDSLLKNTKHPDLFPEDWGVDDGTGFIDEGGYLRDDGAETWWNPVAWVNHWVAFYCMRELVQQLSNAYLYTHDPKYAGPALVLLDRIGDVYPDLDLRRMYEDFTHVGEAADGHGWAGFYNADGGTQQGRFVGAIWEASRIRAPLRAYDRIFPGIDEADEAIDFLAEKTEEYTGLEDKSSPGAVRENVEEGFVQEMLPAFRRADIRGNFGFHQQTIAVAAICADDPDGMTADAVDYMFQPGTMLHPNDDENPIPGRWTTTGGDVLGFLVGSPQSGYMVDEEGYPTESATHYNTSQQNSLEGVADELRGYDAYEGADLYQNPKFKQAVDSHWQLTFGKYIPQIANTHGVGNPKAVAGSTPLNGRTIQSTNFALTGFDEYRNPELAQWTYMLNGLSTDGISLGIHHPNPEGIDEEIEAIVAEHGAFPAGESDQQPAYGFSALRDGDAASPRGVYQYYGRNSFGTGSAHTHRDTLHLGVYGYDLDLAPQLGRQGDDWEDNDLDSWVESTPAHNTVTVDEENVHPQWVGYPRHFDHTDRVQLMDVDGADAYPQTDEYQRTTAMINADDDASYVVDVFRVDGGDDHHYSFHGMTSHGVETDGLDLEAQDGGTYEGENVGFGDGGHFSYLYDVERDDSPGDGFSVDWDIKDYWEVRDDDGGPVHLRLTMLNDDIDEVALATGRPAEQVTENNPEELSFLLAHRTGADVRTTFTSIIEPYENDRVVASATAVPVDSDDEDADLDAVRAVRVELENGRTDYVISSTDTDSDFVVDDTLVFKGAFGVYAERDGDREFVYANDAKLLRRKGTGRPVVQHNQPAFAGHVEDFTRDLSLENELHVRLESRPRDVDLEDLVGNYVYVEPNDPDPVPDGVQEDDRYDNEARDKRNGVFEIEGIERGADNRVVINVGEHTFIRRYYTNDPADGYSYNIEEGAEVRIPFGDLVE